GRVHRAGRGRADAMGHARALEARRHVSAPVQLRLGARTIDVALVPDGEGWSADVDGQRHRLADVASGALSTVGGATVEELFVPIDGTPYAALAARTRDRIHVALGGATYAFDVGEDARGAGGAGAGSGTVVAPMPGKVVKVLVAPGDAVEPGQPLVVIE